MHRHIKNCCRSIIFVIYWAEHPKNVDDHHPSIYPFHLLLHYSFAKIYAVMFTALPPCHPVGRREREPPLIMTYATFLSYVPISKTIKVCIGLRQIECIPKRVLFGKSSITPTIINVVRHRIRKHRNTQLK